MVDPSLVSNVSWSVAGFENDKLEAIHSTKWLFNANGTVSAGTYWQGQWIEIGQNAVRVAIQLKNGATDGFDVLFVTPNRFIAIRGGMVYRYGKKA